MWRRVVLVRTDVSEECISSIFTVKIISELETTLEATSNCSTLLVTANVIPSSLILATLMMEAIRSFGISVLTRVTRRNIPDDGILHSHRRENFKSYIALTGWTLWRRRNMFPVRYELSFLSQKTAFFIVTAVKTSNLTRSIPLRPTLMSPSRLCPSHRSHHFHSHFPAENVVDFPSPPHTSVHFSTITKSLFRVAIMQLLALYLFRLPANLLLLKKGMLFLCYSH
jgi:hypothetical protein